MIHWIIFSSSLLRLMGLAAIYQAPRTSAPHPAHRIYPYLLKGMVIERPNLVWCADITPDRGPGQALHPGSARVPVLGGDHGLGDVPCSGLDIPVHACGSGPVHLVVDSTGLKVFGEGEWKVRQHGVSRRRLWRKLHLGVDEATGMILTHKPTPGNVHDGPVPPKLLARTSLRERLIKTGARLVRHGRYAIFQMPEAALPRQVFASILALINGLRGPPAATVSA